MSIIATAAHLAGASADVRVLGALSLGLEVTHVSAILGSRLGVPATQRTRSYARVGSDEKGRILAVSSRRWVP